MLRLNVVTQISAYWTREGVHQNDMLTEEKAENQIETQAAHKVAPADGVSMAETAGELNEARWSVVSFDRCEAAGLTYAQAEQKMDELLAASVYGLCIVTDEAAERVVSGESRVVRSKL